MALTSTANTTVISTAVPASEQNTSKRILLSCIIGNAIEWYDFVIYGYFAVIFGQLFFPHADPVTQCLASWGIFWAGFFARPLGSIVFGHIGDKVSRKSALTLSIYVMAIPTTLIGCLPTYEHIGIVAPFLLVFCRTFQGFAIGGEFTGSMVFLVEHAPQQQRGFWGSWAFFSTVMGVIVGSMVITSLNVVLPTDAMQQWGWRIPFLMSILGSVVGVYIRSRLVDPKVYLEAKAKNKKKATPLKEVFAKHKSKMGIIILLDFLTAIGFFIVAIFIATYFRTYLKAPEHVALAINTFTMCVLALATLVGGLLADKYGKRITLLLPCLGFVLFSYPLFEFFPLLGNYSLLFAHCGLAILLGIFLGAIPMTLVDIMPTNVRYSGLSLSHNISMAIFGGGTPFVATHLLQNTQNLASPAYLLIVAATLSMLSLLFIKNKPAL